MNSIHTYKLIDGGKKQRKTRKMKKMNCNPIVDGKTVDKSSCMTPDVLKRLRTSYNKHHINDSIKSKEPTKIWKELKQKLSTCSKEDCWLDTIKDNKVRKELLRYSFAPKQPNSWKKEPSTWLTNYDILEVLKQYETAYSHFKFIGPTPIDFDSRPLDYNDECVWKDLCAFELKHFVTKEITKIGVVFNLDKHDEPGSHWTSLFIDLEEQLIFYMDSAGDTIPPEVNTLVIRIMKQGLEMERPLLFTFHENAPFEHQRGNNECGMYSLYFIITMLTGKSGRRKFKTVDDKITYFKTERIPDTYVFKHRKKYFNS